MAGMRQVVDPPSFTPVPFGLLSTVEFPPITGPHWQNGITYQPLCGVTVTGTGTTYNPCLAVTGTGHPPTPPDQTGNVTRLTRGATSFVVRAEFDCAPVGNDQAQQIAEQALAMSEPWQVERAFWTGIAAGQPVVYPHLAAASQVLDSDGVILQTAAINVTGAAGLLRRPGRDPRPADGDPDYERAVRIERPGHDHQERQQGCDWRRLPRQRA
jgi:hypothetical protein